MLEDRAGNNAQVSRTLLFKLTVAAHQFWQPLASSWCRTI
jgi:hypothetical protein